MPVTGNRKAISHLYRPQGPKLITTVAATPGTVQQVIQAVDLTVPIRGFRLVSSGRLVVGTAAFTTTNPEGFLNLLANVLIQGISKRQGGNAQLWNLDLATIFNISHLTDVKGGIYLINGVQQLTGALSPYPSTFSGATGTFDWKITIDLPAYPVDAPQGVRSGWLIRQDEWKDSIQMKFTFAPADTNAVPQGLGQPAATTTLTFSAFGSGSGNPTLDIYTLPQILGDLRNSTLPGLISRTNQPVTGPVQGGTVANVELLRLQKQSTPRVYMKMGVINGQGFFSSLLDTPLSAVGIQLGTDRNVRDTLDIFSHKHDTVEQYGTQPIQGYLMLDFIQSGNPDSAYGGDELGDGTTFRLLANVVGAANQEVLTVQEQVLYKPEGAIAGG